MRTLICGFVTLSLLAACGGPPDDAISMDADSTEIGAEAEPAVLTAEAIHGTWKGRSMAEVGDSVTQHWTFTRHADGTAGFVYEGSSDTIRYSSIISGDSVVSTSEPYMVREAPAGSPQIRVRSVGRLVDGRLSGTATVMLATSPDSVVGRGRWEATRAQ